MSTEDAPPPLPKRVRRWTVTQEALTDAIGRVRPWDDRGEHAEMAAEILGHLPPALSLAWPVDAAPVPVPDHECSFLLNDPEGKCRHGCGKTWARNVAERNLDQALADFAATEPAPPREERPFLDALAEAVMALPPRHADRQDANGTAPVSPDGPDGSEALSASDGAP